jgi:hypothetical protein
LLGYETKPNGAADCGFQRPRCAAGVAGNSALGVLPRSAPSFVVGNGGEVQSRSKINGGNILGSPAKKIEKGGAVRVVAAQSDISFNIDWSDDGQVAPELAPT